MEVAKIAQALDHTHHTPSHETHVGYCTSPAAHCAPTYHLLLHVDHCGVLDTRWLGGLPTPYHTHTHCITHIYTYTLPHIHAPSPIPFYPPLYILPTHFSGFYSHTTYRITTSVTYTGLIWAHARHCCWTPHTHLLHTIGTRVGRCSSCARSWENCGLR